MVTGPETLWSDLGDLFFPRENHNLTRTGEPKHLVESMKWQLYWFDKHLTGNENAKAPDEP